MAFDRSAEAKIETDLVRLRVFSRELGLLREQLDSRLAVLRRIQNQPIVGPQGPVPEWDFAFTRFGGARTDPGANLAVKSFFFVARQAIDQSLHIMYLVRDELGSRRDGYHLPDGSRSKAFATLYEGIMENRYDYDGDVLDALRRHRDVFIIVRMARNLLKSLGTFDVHLINGEPSIVIPILAETRRKDKTLQYVERLTVPVEDVRNFTCDALFLKHCHRVLTGFGRLLEEKWIVVKQRLPTDAETAEST